MPGREPEATADWARFSNGVSFYVIAIYSPVLVSIALTTNRLAISPLYSARVCIVYNPTESSKKLGS